MSVCPRHVKFHLTAVSFLPEGIKQAPQVLIEIKIKVEIYKSRVKREQPISKHWCLHTGYPPWYICSRLLLVTTAKAQQKRNTRTVMHSIAFCIVSC